MSCGSGWAVLHSCLLYTSYNGLLDGECFEMNLRSVSNIISAGGTILYTARCLEFKTCLLYTSRCV